MIIHEGRTDMHAKTTVYLVYSKLMPLSLPLLVSISWSSSITVLIVLVGNRSVFRAYVLVIVAENLTILRWEVG